MSAEEAVSLMQGIADRRHSPKMSTSRNVPAPAHPQQQHQQQLQEDHRELNFVPDNSCCFCLTLRSGTGIIAGLNCLFYLGTVVWYLSTSSLDLGGIRDGDIISSLDISIFSICVVMIMVSILLMVSSIRQVPCQTLPWLCANTVIIIMAMIMIIYTILFGMSTFKWTYSEYVTMLSVMGFLTGATLFCWIVVFTFRKNLLMVAKYSLAPTAQSTGLSNGSQDSSKCPSTSPSAPPPAYSDIDTSSWKPSPEASSAGAEPKDEPGPPGYEDVVGQQLQQVQQPQQVQPVQRKKSLTNHHV